MLPAGDYDYEATVEHMNQRMTKKGRIAIRELLAEKLSLVADHRLLYQIGSRTGGGIFYRDQMNGILQKLRESQHMKPVRYGQLQTSSPIDLKWLFFVILFLFALEWAVRKRFFGI
jgi:hypothetical protein